MRDYKKQLSWLLVAVIVMTAMLPAAPVYAFSLQDLMGQTNGSGGQSFVGLLGVLIDNLFGKLANIIPGVPNNNGGEVVTPKQGKEIVGFYAEWWGKDTSSFNSLKANADAIGTIAPFWATLQSDGSLTNRGGDDHASVVDFAHNNNVSALLLVNNAKEANGQIPIHTLLSNPDLRTKAIANLEEYIKQYKLDGVNIDFEMVPAEDRDNVTAFMKELSSRLKSQGYLVTIDVFPKQDESNDVAIAYDYAQLSQFADKIMIMSYDNHGMWSKAGPIAGIEWVEKNLAYALKSIPKNKLYLGIAAYGYDWSTKGVNSLEYGALMDLAKQYNAEIKWDEQSKSPHFAYRDADGVDHQVWFENQESLKYKLDLVNRYDIAGVAMWKLGEEDPGYWQVFKDKLRIKK